MLKLYLSQSDAWSEWQLTPGENTDFTVHEEIQTVIGFFQYFEMLPGPWLVLPNCLSAVKE